VMANNTGTAQIRISCEVDMADGRSADSQKLWAQTRWKL